MFFISVRMSRLRCLSCFLLIAMSIAGCEGSYEDTVADVTVPIPGGMKKSTEKRVELSLPGFGGGQASYRGDAEPNRIIDFYKKEMPARGWKPSVGVLSQSGMLTYTKDDKSVVVMAEKGNGDTTLTITVGAAKR